MSVEGLLESVWAVISRMATCQSVDVPSELPEREHITHFGAAASTSYMASRALLLARDVNLPFHLSSENFCAIAGHDLLFADVDHATTKLSKNTDVGPVTRLAATKAFGLYIDALRTNVDDTAWMFGDPVDLLLLLLLDAPQTNRSLFGWMGVKQTEVEAVMQHAESALLVNRHPHALSITDLGRRRITLLRHQLATNPS
jgi:hypothetical protein